jgi:hypothetical protein
MRAGNMPPYMSHHDIDTGILMGVSQYWAIA